MPKSQRARRTRTPRARPVGAGYDDAVALLRAHRLDEALAAYDAVLAGEPSHADALSDSAIALAMLGRTDAAIARFERAAAAAPAAPDIHHNLGMALGQAGRFDEAARALGRATAMRPANAEWWTDLGDAHLAAQRHAEALDAFDAALRRAPRLVNALSNRALALRALLRAAEAEAACRATLAVDPTRVDAMSNLGLILMEDGRFDEAGAEFARAHALAPTHAAVRANRCNLLLRSGERGEALAIALEAAHASDAPVEAWTLLAHAQLENAQYEEALASCERALAIAPANATAQFSRGVVLLGLGRCEEGFEAYNARLRINNQIVQARRPDGVEWDGAPLGGRTILLTAEQGAGDAFHFVRYAAQVKARGAGRVIVEALPSLCAMLATAPGVDEVAPTDAPYPPYDVHAPLLSLPRLMGTRLDTISADVPYLTAPVHPIGARVRAAPGRRVGFVWNGNPRQNRNRIRNVSVAALLDALDVPGVSLFSLQVGSAPEPAFDAAVAAGRVVDLAPELPTFTETAAAVDACDVVVSIDTSVAHLAGALGRATWTLLPLVPDWRWLHDRADSPWYPTMRLFRQAAFDDWTVPLAAVRAHLLGLVATPAQGRAARGTDEARTHKARGLALRAQRDDAGAMDAFARAAACDAADGEAWLEYARCAAARRRHDVAEDAYDRALALDPRNATIIGDRAVTLRNTLRHDEAIAACREALVIEPANHAIRSNLGVFLKEVRRIDEAEQVFAEGLRGTPDHPLLLSNLATLYHEAGRLAEATALAERLVGAHPRAATGYIVRGCLAMEFARYEDAATDFEHALVLDPANATADWNLSHVRLLAGDLENGFRGLERRREVGGLVYEARTLPGTEWAGEALTGKTVFVHQEQGLGDVLQFVRYAAELKRRGAARVIVEAPPDAARLVSSAPGVDAVAPRGAPIPTCDVFVSIMSLPHRCGTRSGTIPSTVPYLRAQPGVVAERVRQAPGAVKVGIVWGGNPQHQRDRFRSMPFPALLSAVHMDGIALFSLQKGPHARALAPWRDALGVIDLDAQLQTLDDTAAAVMALDLVISVDTAVAHLAGALGRPIWTLHPLLPDWRWGRDGADSAWYPTMRLFRQDAPGDWSRPLGQLRDALEALLPAHASH